MQSRSLVLSALMSFILFVASASWGSEAITHGPRLGLVTSTAATIYWDTDQPGPGLIEWGTNKSYGSTKIEADATTAHRLTITGLSRATTYHYRVVTGAAHSPDHTFSTAVPPETAFTFISMADNRGQATDDDLNGLPKAFEDIVALSIAKQPSFVLHVGDIFHAHWDVLDTLYSIFKQATDALAAETPFLISPGNHEMSQNGTIPDGSDPLAVFNQQFAQPTGPDPLNLITDHYPGSVFSFDWGNSHFVSVDNCRYDMTKTLPRFGMYQVSAAELSWLRNDLQTAQSRGVRHIFVMAHANAFMAQGEGPTGMAIYASERDQLWQILVDYNVDAYITGHVHEFNDEWGQQSGTKWDNSSVVHWMNGDSGSVFDSSDNPLPGQNHWTLWTVRGDTVTAELYNDFGNRVHTRVIQSSQPPTPLASTFPSPNAIDVPVSAVITATFADSVPAGTTTFVVNGSGGIPVPGAVAFNDKTATFTPSIHLSNAETYTAAIQSAAVGSAKWSFTTEGGGKATPLTATATGRVTIDTSANPGTNLKNVIALSDADASLNQAHKPEGLEFTDGVVSYNVTSVTPGATIEVSLTVPSGIPKASKVFQISTDGFHEWKDASLQGSTIVLTLTDGGAGDNDAVEDGTISNAVGIAAPRGQLGASETDDGGCAISTTAAASSYCHPLIWLTAVMICVGIRGKPGAVRQGLNGCRRRPPARVMTALRLFGRGCGGRMARRARGALVAAPRRRGGANRPPPLINVQSRVGLQSAPVIGDHAGRRLSQSALRQRLCRGPRSAVPLRLP